MDRKVIISKRASLKLAQLLDYLKEEWSEKVRNEFIEKLNRAILIIRKNPEGFERSKLVIGLSRCVVTKQISLFYKFDKTNIYIVSFFDNRKNPDCLKREIN